MPQTTEHTSEDHEDVLGLFDDSISLPLADSETASTAVALPTWPEVIRARTMQGMRGAARMPWAKISLVLFVVSMLTAWSTPTNHDPLARVFQSSLCASPLASSFTFCGSHTDVIVMYDFVALGQLHTMTLDKLYEGALVEGQLSNKLAHSGRSVKELAYRVEDSSLPSKDIIAHETHKLNKETRTAADSLYKLDAGTTGAITRCVDSYIPCFHRFT